MFADFKTTFPQITIFSLNQIPIPDLKKNEWIKIEEIVSTILNNKLENPTTDTTLLELEIDQLVYEIYGLTEEEIEIVEGESK